MLKTFLLLLLVLTTVLAAEANAKADTAVDRSGMFDSVQNFFIQAMSFLAQALGFVGFSQLETATEDDSIPMPALVTQFGYECEEHTYTTEDGYINTLFRIPPSPQSASSRSAKARAGSDSCVVFVQHGIFASADHFVIGSPSKTLGYMLADDGCDVWLGNARGTTYSRQHVSLTTEDTEYWQFSWHEMGKYDIRAALEYVLTVTGASSLSYIGHSMGTTMFWVAMNEHQDWMEEHVNLMIGMAPVASVEHLSFPLWTTLAPFANELEFLFNALGENEFMPSDPVMEEIIVLTCDTTTMTEEVCANTYYAFLGFNPEQTNYTLVPVIMGHSPSATSTQTVIHYAQCINSGRFAKFDYGLDGNLARYGSDLPPEYDIAKVTVPVVVMWAESDTMADPQDVQWLMDGLNSTNHLAEAYQVPDPSFSHTDFTFGKDAYTLVYAEVLRQLRLV